MSLRINGHTITADSKAIYGYIMKLFESRTFDMERLVPWLQEITRQSNLALFGHNTQPLTVDTYDRGIEAAERYKFSLYDSMVAASALRSGCKIPYSEDLQHRQVFDEQLTVINPFAGT
jgi:hypothetical protein